MDLPPAPGAYATAHKIPTGELRRVRGRALEQSMQRTARHLPRPMASLRLGWDVISVMITSVPP